MTILYRGCKYVEATALTPYTPNQTAIPPLEAVVEYYLDDAKRFGTIEDIAAEMSYDDPDASMDAAREELAERIEDWYTGSLHTLSSQGALGTICWRALRVPVDFDPVAHHQLGIYWSLDQDGADDYHAEDEPGTHVVVYMAKPDLKYVNKVETVWANCEPEFGENMQEVRFYPDSPIYVYSVELPDGTELPINDWRTTEEI